MKTTCIVVVMFCVSLCASTSLAFSPRPEQKSETLPEAKQKTVCMFFPSPYGPKHMWDTWLYYHEGTYYLFWLDGRPHWSGHAVATSKDAVYWKLIGRIYSKKEGVKWLGTGHTWKSPDFEKTGKFINNYSEWHNNKNAQDIHFAESTDLIHWKKVDEKYRFVQDTQWYKEKGRWDCIDTLARPGGGLYGFWTATPDERKVPGARVGFGESLDGLTWKALKPPVLQVKHKHVELGGIHKIGDTYYMMISEGVVLRSQSIHGPFVPQPKNTNIVPGDLYFPRFFHNHPDGLMVNYHMKGRSILFAPLKRAVLDKEGIMRTMWWEGNEALKKKTLEIKPGTERGGIISMLQSQFPAEDGVILEGKVQPAADADAPPRGIYFDTGGDLGSALLFFSDRTEFGTMSAKGTDKGVKCGHCGVIRRDVTFGPNATFRVLLKLDAIEVYCNDYLMQAKRFPEKWNGRIGLIGSDDSLIELRKAFTPGKMAK